MTSGDSSGRDAGEGCHRHLGAAAGDAAQDAPCCGKPRSPGRRVEPDSHGHALAVRPRARHPTARSFTPLRQRKVK